MVAGMEGVVNGDKVVDGDSEGADGGNHNIVMKTKSQRL